MDKTDVYLIHLDENSFGAFQLYCVDRTQMSSDVVRVFKTLIKSRTMPNCEAIAGEPVLFETHTSIAAGVKLGLWEKYGEAILLERSPTLFRISDDYGNPAVKFSRRWRIWYPNEPMSYIGSLNDIQRSAEIGTVTNPHSLVERIKTGKRTHFYPAG